MNATDTRFRLAVLLILWAAAFVPVYPELFWTWLNNANDSHGILVPFISLFLIWQRREKLRHAKISNSHWGLVVLITSMSLYLLSYAGGVAVVSRAMIVSSFIGLVLFTLGREAFRLLAFPLFFLFFMVPVPQSVLNLIAFPLQLFVTDLSFLIIHWFSIPVYQEGNMLYFAQAQFEVAEACSGIRSLVSFAMLGVLFSYMLSHRGWVRKAVILASVVPLALSTNIVRVIGTAVLVHFFGQDVARGFLHELSGLLLFALGFILFLGEYALLNRLRAD
jgi:exosortase